MESIAQLLEDRQLLENRQKAIQDNKGSPIIKIQIEQKEKEIIAQIKELILKLPFNGRIHLKDKMISGEIEQLKIINGKKSPPVAKFKILCNGKCIRRKIDLFEELVDIFSWEIES